MPQSTSLNNSQTYTPSQNVVPRQWSQPPQPQFPNPNAIPAQQQFTQPHATPQASPIRQQLPIRTQANPFPQHSIPAPEAPVPSTPEQRIPKSINGEGVKNSRKQGMHPHLMQQMVDSAFDANSWVTSRKIVLSYPTALNARLEATSQQSVLPSNRTTGSRTKGVKVPMKDAKLIERIGRKHRPTSVV